MKYLVPAFLAALFATSAAHANDAERIFDIVPGEGQAVESNQGATVLRLPGKQYGVVLSYIPDTATRGWIPIAILNTGTASIDVGTAGVTAEAGGQPLTVQSRAAVLSDFRSWLGGEGARGSSTRSSVPKPGRGMRSADGRHKYTALADSDVAKDFADRLSKRDRKMQEQQLKALEERLLADRTLAPREVAQGQVRLELPAPTAGAPAEFTLRLEFGGEPLQVRYRERVVQDPAQAPAAQ
jgi:hypothetical protein